MEREPGFRTGWNGGCFRVGNCEELTWKCGVHLLWKLGSHLLPPKIQNALSYSLSPFFFFLPILFIDPWECRIKLILKSRQELRSWRKVSLCPDRVESWRKQNSFSNIWLMVFKQCQWKHLMQWQTFPATLTNGTRALICFDGVRRQLRILSSINSIFTFQILRNWDSMVSEYRISRFHPSAGEKTYPDLHVWNLYGS